MTAPYLCEHGSGQGEELDRCLIGVEVFVMKSRSSTGRHAHHSDDERRLLRELYVGYGDADGEGNGHAWAPATATSRATATGCRSESKHVSFDQAGLALELLEGGAQCSIALGWRLEVPVVRRRAPRCLPHALDCVELRRVRGQPMQLDSMRVTRQPGSPLGSEVVTWPVVDDQEDLPTIAT